MTIRELFDRDLRAGHAAVGQYERAAERLFALEELYRAAGCEPACIREAHRAAIVAGHAAYAEIKNPEPRR